MYSALLLDCTSCLNQLIDISLSTGLGALESASTFEGLGASVESSLGLGKEVALDRSVDDMFFVARVSSYGRGQAKNS